MIPIFIYVFTPICGVLAYWALVRTMRGKRLSSPPVIPFFILFATFGGWLLVLLTAWFWEWSGMASLGMIYLLLIAPVVTGVMAGKLYSQRPLSLFHTWAFLFSGIYTFLMLVGIPLAFGLRLIGK